MFFDADCRTRHREALHPYVDDLVIVTKVSARRGEDGSWIPAMSRDELTDAVHDNVEPACCPSGVRIGGVESSVPRNVATIL
jgi:hypothetical protein